ncbi:MAG: hypothetical protein LBN37_05055, partial [Bacteroidales bacterium]|nr:hypothetical protein [Bacteroidales bacterium]
MKTYLNLFFLLWFAVATYAQTTSFQSDFGKGKTGGLPEGWTLNDFQNPHAPRFALKKDASGNYLSLKGNGVRFVISELRSKYGIFDTAGRDVQNPYKDPSHNIIKGDFETFKDVRTFD